jgi:hypothetical protein
VHKGPLRFIKNLITYDGKGSPGGGPDYQPGVSLCLHEDSPGSEAGQGGVQVNQPVPFICEKKFKGTVQTDLYPSKITGNVWLKIILM